MTNNNKKERLEYDCIINRIPVIQCSVNDTDKERIHLDYQSHDPDADIQEINLSIEGKYNSPIMQLLFKQSAYMKVLKVTIEIEDKK